MNRRSLIAPPWWARRHWWQFWKPKAATWTCLNCGCEFTCDARDAWAQQRIVSFHGRQCKEDKK